MYHKITTTEGAIFSINPLTGERIFYVNCNGNDPEKIPTERIENAIMAGSNQVYDELMEMGIRVSLIPLEKINGDYVNYLDLLLSPDMNNTGYETDHFKLFEECGLVLIHDNDDIKLTETGKKVKKSLKEIGIKSKLNGKPRSSRVRKTSPRRRGT